MEETKLANNNQSWFKKNFRRVIKLSTILIIIASFWVFVMINLMAKTLKNKVWDTDVQVWTNKRWIITYTSWDVSQIKNIEIEAIKGNIENPVIVSLYLDAEIASGKIAQRIKRYYFDVNDPERILGVKTTPITESYVFLTINIFPGEYRFAADIYDNQGKLLASSEWETPIWPSEIFEPSTSNLDIPMVTLKADKRTIKSWESISYEMFSKVFSNEADFKLNRVMVYDFDGDWVWDITTGSSTISHVYHSTGSFSPKGKVIYRGSQGVAIGEKIVVE